MVVPPFLGQEFLASADGLADAQDGFPTEVMAHTAAANIAAQVKGEQPTHRKAFGDITAVCVTDAGNNGVIILPTR